MFWLAERVAGDSGKNCIFSSSPTAVREVNLWLTPGRWQTDDPWPQTKAQSDNHDRLEPMPTWPPQSQERLWNKFSHKPHWTMATIERPCCTPPPIWLKFLWRGCMKISDSEITGIQMKKINISPAQSGLLSPSPSWTIRWSHVNYDKWRSGGMCVLRQAFSFFFPFSCGGSSQMWCVISHQHQSQRVFTVSVITVDLIRVCIQRPNQPHAWPESLTRGWTNTREGKSTERKTTFPLSWSKPFLGGSVHGGLSQDLRRY